MTGLTRTSAAMSDYQPSGTGATTRVLSDRIGDFAVSVKDFGAKGDGTTDDHAAITAAIAAVKAAGGGTVEFPKGRYMTSATIDIPITYVQGNAGTANERGEAQIRLRGLSERSLIRATSTSVSPLIRVLGGFTYIERLTLQRAVNATPAGIGIQCGRTDSTAGIDNGDKNYPCLITGCRLESFEKAVYVWDFEDVIFQNNYSINCTSTFYAAENGMGSRIVDNTMLGGGPCIYFTHPSGGQQAEGVVIAHNHIYANGTEPQRDSSGNLILNGGHGIHIAGGLSFKIVANVIGEVEDPAVGDAYGIYLDGSTNPVKFITVLGNWIGGASSGETKLGNSGIFLRGNVRECKVTNNEISTLAGYGIAVEGAGATDNVLLANSVVGVDTADIEIHQAVRTMVAHNVLAASKTDPETHAVLTVPVLEIDNSSKSLVLGNVIQQGTPQRSSKSTYCFNFGDDLTLSMTAAAHGRHRGCLFYRNSDVGIPNATPVDLEWNVPDRDTDGVYDGSQPSWVKVPSWAKLCRITASVEFGTSTAGYRTVTIRKNASGAQVGRAITRAAAADNSNVSAVTAWIPVSAGDYFQVRVTQDSGGTLAVNGVDGDGSGYVTWVQAEFQ